MPGQAHDLRETASLIRDLFERAHPATFCQASGVTHRPVVVAQVPPEPIERDLYRELLASMDAPALAGGTLAREKDVCRSLCDRPVELGSVREMTGRASFRLYGL